MQALKPKSMPRATHYLLSALLVVPTLTFAQDPSAPATGGWKRVGDPSAQAQPSPDYTEQQQPGAPAGESMQAPPTPPGNANGQPNYAPNYPPYAGQNNPAPQAPQNYPPQAGYPQQAGPQSQSGYQQQGYPPQANYQQQPVPASLSIPAGTYLTVRINQMLSSDRNQQGDAFSASLVKPLVVNGVVVAEPGQTLGGHVVEAVKAGHVTGVARLGVQLTDLTLVDGQQIPIRTSLINRSGPTSIGQDAGTIAGTTAVGAAIGAAADWGRGAAIGAGAGAAAGIIGVLVTRGHPSILYPEQVLTFRLEAPITVNTAQAPQAYRYVQPGEYEQPIYTQQGPAPQGPGYYGGGAAYAAPAPYYGYPYPYYAYGYGYPYYGGPSFSLFYGRGFYGGYYGGYRYGGRGYYGGGYGHVGGGGFVGHASGGHAGGGRR